MPSYQTTLTPEYFSPESYFQSCVHQHDLLPRRSINSMLCPRRETMTADALAVAYLTKSQPDLQHQCILEVRLRRFGCCIKHGSGKVKCSDILPLVTPGQVIGTSRQRQPMLRVPSLTGLRSTRAICPRIRRRPDDNKRPAYNSIAITLRTCPPYLWSQIGQPFAQVSSPGLLQTATKTQVLANHIPMIAHTPQAWACHLPERPCLELTADDVTAIVIHGAESVYCGVLHYAGYMSG